MGTAKSFLDYLSCQSGNNQLINDVKDLLAVSSNSTVRSLYVGTERTLADSQINSTMISPSA